MDESIRQEMIALLPRLRAFARALTGAADQADDLVQVTLEKALRGIAGYEAGTRLDSWMFRIMRNAHLDIVRSRRPETSVDDADAAAELVGEDGRRTTEARLHLAEVRRAMATLPEDQREVLMLVCVDGMAYREVAEALGIPAGTVMSRLSRARMALAARLGLGAAGEHAGKGTRQ
ncbi:RNA polymerase sigma factor [Aliigemmobacter aestuarii]|nr:RNA polymerase sigma factor [Gemmobacter aestuarii]